MTKSAEENATVNGGSSSSAADSGYPKRFGPYEIHKELGRGGMATVYLATDTRLERKVALKVPHKTVAADPEYMARFLREARSAATLTHPNICTIFEVGEIGGTPYMTMALVEGKSLTELIAEEHPIPLKRIAIIVRKIALAMELAHREGIIHRDLKPANIMIDSRREPVIMDFGLARREDTQEDSRLTQDGLLIGTPIYMAPEVAKKGAGVSGAITDIYSLGAILYELLAGRPPYKGTVQAVLVQVMRGQPKPPSSSRSDIDSGIESICLQAMAKDPSERFQSMSEFAAALRDYIQNPDSTVTAGVEVVEVVEEKPSVEPESQRTTAERKSSSERGVSSRSGSKISRRPPPKKADSVKFVSILIGTCVLAFVVIIGAIISIKKIGRSEKPPAVIATPAPAPVTPAVPEPPPPILSNDAGIKWNMKRARISSSFRGFLPFHFPEITAADGWYRFIDLRVMINGETLDTGRLGDESWTAEERAKPPKTFHPVYRIPADWLGELKAGNKIEVRVDAFLVYLNPANVENPTSSKRVTSRCQIEIISPEDAAKK
jgi:serine/threonine protein kinase